MRESQSEIDQSQADNLAEFMEHGPGLRLSTRTWVLARDPEKKQVQLGGLGAFGVGRMWFLDDPSMSLKLGYDDAPLMHAPEDNLCDGTPW